METEEAVGRLNEWLDLLYEIHSAHSDPGNSQSQRSRVKGELLPFYLDEDEWSGDAPFSRFVDQLKPSVATKGHQAVFDQLARRTLFKAERWSAPDVGGVARCLVSQPNKGFEGDPDLVFDVSDVGGSLKIVAMHSACPVCVATGVLDDGGPCEHVDPAGVPCVDGLHFQGGLAFDPGELEASVRLSEPPHARWARYMER